MTTRLIELDDGLLVEVEADEGMPQRISARSAGRWKRDWPRSKTC